MRAALEALAMRQAVVHYDGSHDQQLQSIVDQMMAAVEHKDPETIIRLDNRFHETILQASGNRLLYHLWKSLEFGRWTIITYRLTSYDTEYLARRHAELLEALRCATPERAALAMLHHIEDLGQPSENDTRPAWPPS